MEINTVVTDGRRSLFTWAVFVVTAATVIITSVYVVAADVAVARQGHREIHVAQQFVCLVLHVVFLSLHVICRVCIMCTHAADHRGQHCALSAVVAVIGLPMQAWCVTLLVGSPWNMDGNMHLALTLHAVMYVVAVFDVTRCQ